MSYESVPYILVIPHVKMIVMAPDFPPRWLQLLLAVAFWVFLRKYSTGNVVNGRPQSCPREFGGDIILLQDEPWHRSGLVRRRLPPRFQFRWLAS
jgi:hypothetical protein